MSGFPVEDVIHKPLLDESPLKTVICQVRFQEILGSLDDEVRGFQKKLGDQYPLNERIQEEEIRVGDQGLKPTGKTRSTFRFQDPDQGWTVTLSPEALSLETSAYAGFADFATRWHFISESAVAEFGIQIQERLGLRYVNQVEINSVEDVKSLVRPELLAIADEECPVAKDLAASFQETRFDQGNGHLMVRRGLLITDEDPIQRIYVLDFDYFSDDRVDFSVDKQSETLIVFNEAVSRFFRWAITDEAYSSFGPREENR